MKIYQLPQTCSWLFSSVYSSVIGNVLSERMAVEKQFLKDGKQGEKWKKLDNWTENQCQQILLIDVYKSIMNVKREVHGEYL